MVESNVDDTVPCLIDGGQVLCSLFDEWKKDETEELIRNTGFDNIFNLFDEDDQEPGSEDE